MECWILNKKELRFIAKLMVEHLHTLPDKSELSVINMFEQTLSAERVEGFSKDGYHVHGLKIKDIKLNDGYYLHDFIKWDFVDGVWQPGLNDGMYLDNVFEKKAIISGYLVDPAIRGGRRMGLPYYLSSIYRNKKNLIESFIGVEEKVTNLGNDVLYYIQEIKEKRAYHFTNEKGELIHFERIKPLQLWRIPKECQTGKVLVANNYIRFTILKGKCLIERSHWDYEKPNPKRKAFWSEHQDKRELRINQSDIARNNRNEENNKPPQEAWFQINNIGKSDLLLFVVDTSRFQTVYYE